MVLGGEQMIGCLFNSLWGEGALLVGLYRSLVGRSGSYFVSSRSLVLANQLRTTQVSSDPSRPAQINALAS